MGIYLGGDMVYRKYHWEQSEQCDGGECTALTAYVRIEGKWTRIGYYGSECKKFEPLDLQKEEQDKLAKQRRDNIKLEMRQIRHWIDVLSRVPFFPKGVPLKKTSKFFFSPRLKKTYRFLVKTKVVADFM